MELNLVYFFTHSGKASVGSPSARRLTRSTPTGSRDLRKRGNISSESKTAQGSGKNNFNLEYAKKAKTVL